MTEEFFRRVICLFTVVGLVSLPPTVSGQGITEIIAVTGSASPDGNGTFWPFGVPALNNAGQTAFFAPLTGTTGGIDDNSGVYRGEALIGALTQIAREDPAGSFDSGLTDLESPAINDGGQLAFLATYLQSQFAGRKSFRGVYRGSGGLLTAIAAEGDAAPDGNGTFSFFFDPALNAAGQVAFRALLTDTPQDDGVFVGSFGAVTQIAREGAVAPDGNGIFASFRFPALNASGQAAFYATLTGTSDNEGIFLGSGGSLTQIARAGAEAPGGNGIFAGFYYPALNASGQVAFNATLTNTSGGLSDNSGIFVGSGGTVTQIARAGEAAPDGNGVFSIFGVDTALNDLGQAAFTAILTGTTDGESNDEGIFLGSAGSVTQIAREGADAPDGNGVFAGFGSPALNASGQMAFYAYLAGTSNPAIDKTGIFLANGIDTIQVARAALNKLQFNSSAGANGDERSAINDAGQVAFLTTLDSGEVAIVRYTIPDIHWTELGSGSWATDANWTQAIEPNSFHDTFIDPDSGIVVTGNYQNSHVKSLTIGATSSGEAVLLIDNGGDLEAIEAITINDRGRIVVGSERVLTAKTLSNSGVLTGHGQVDAVLTNQSTGKVRVASGEHLRVTGNGTHSNAGVIEVIGGTAEFTGAVTNRIATGLVTGENATFRFNDGLSNHGAVALSFGTSRIFGDVTNVHSEIDGRIIVSGNSNATFYGDVANNGIINVSTGSTAVFFGALSGNGVGGAGTVFLEGDMRPGASPGTMAFGGDVHLGPFSTLEIELGGTLAGDEFDVVIIDGAATLAGTLNVVLLGDFAPDFSNTFTILEAGSALNGTFDNIPNGARLTTLGGEGSFLITYTDTVMLSSFQTDLPGDYNNNGAVEQGDLDLVLLNWGDLAIPTLWVNDPPTFPIDAGELDNVRQNWGSTTAATTNSAVPEPATLLLLLVAVVGAATWIPEGGDGDVGLGRLWRSGTRDAKRQ